MISILNKIRIYLSLFMMGTLVAACGSGNTPNDPNSAGGIGKTAILLTDHREARIEDHRGGLVTTAKEVWVSIRSIDLKQKDGNWVTVFSGPSNQSVDLLTLDGTAMLLAMAEIPPGRYEKARFSIEEAHFIDRDDVHHDLIVPSKSIKVKFDRPLRISGSGDEKLLFDMVPGKSIHLIETGSGKFLLRPVIKVKLIGEDSSRDMAKIKGEIVSVNCSEEQLHLRLDGDHILEVDLEDAVIIPGSINDFKILHKDGGDDDDDDRDERIFKTACRTLEEGMFVGITGSFDDEFEASTVQILADESHGNRLEFSGLLLDVDCDTRQLKVPFSGGEILVSFHDETRIEQDDLNIDLSEHCDALTAVKNRQISIEGALIDNQVIASRVTLPSTASLTILAIGIVDDIHRNSENAVVGFILAQEDGSLLTVAVDRRFESHTEIMGENGEVITADMINAGDTLEVKGVLNMGTVPHPTLSATKIIILPKNTSG